MSLCYSVARLHAREAYDAHATNTTNSVIWYLTHFLDYIADRVIMVAFNSLVSMIFGTYTLSICAVYVAVLVTLSQKWVGAQPTLQVYKTLAAMRLAQQLYVMLPVGGGIKFILFAAAVLAPDILCGELAWYGQVAVIGFCLSVMDAVDSIAHSVGAGETVFVSTLLIIIIGHLSPVPQYTTKKPATSETFRNAAIGLPAVPS